jgi:hypothetical protein
MVEMVLENPWYTFPSLDDTISPEFLENFKKELLQEIDSYFVQKSIE